MKILPFMALVGLSLVTVPDARAAVLAGPITNDANAHVYYLLSTNTWTASEAEARALGGHLVTINDAAENQWVLNTFFPLTGVPYASLWIGLNDAANEGQFVWASGEPVTFTYWYPGEPNNSGGEDYASIRHPSESPPTGSWNDLSDTSGLQNPAAPIFGVVELPPDPTPLPAASTLPADQFMPGSARLNGLANPSGSPTLAWFDWGTSLAYGNATPPQSVGSGSNVVVGFSNLLTGLVIGTDYHFRARASNAFGLATGLDQTFNLSNQRPIVTTLAADQLTTDSARLRGQVNPRGSPTTAWFEWGTGTNYGNLIGRQNVGQGSSVSNLNVVLNGLTSASIYHYRLVASNAFGAVYGADQTFNPPQPAMTSTWTGADPSGYWSAPANWSPATLPPNGNDLVFPGGLLPGDMVSTNDLTDSFFRSITFNPGSRHTIRGNPMTLTNRANVIINNGTNVLACDLTFSGTPPTPTFGVVSIRGRVASSGVVSELTVIGNVGGGSLYGNLERLVIRGQFTGGTLRLWGGTLAFYGDDPSAGSAEVQNSATLLVQGSRPNLNATMFWEFESAACPFLTGDGVVGDVLGCGRIILDSTLSVKSLGGPGASQYGWRVLDIHLNGTNVGEYGQLISSGDVTLTGGSLSASPGFNPQPGQVFTIIDKTSPGPITTVPGYDTTLWGPEGTIITLNGMPCRLSYVGGDGNDVTLTVEASNTPPTVSITSPPGGAAFAAPASFSVEASASDPDGSVTNVQFFRDATSLGSDTSSPYSVSVSGLVAGNYTLSAVASDNRGRRATNSILISVDSINCLAAPSGVVAWWRAEGNANDATGAHDGQLLFGTAFAQGRTGQAFSFDGVRSRASIPDSDAFKLTDSLTFEGWIQAASWAPGILFIRGDNRGGLDPYHMSLSSSGHLHWGISAADNSFAAVDDPNTLPIGVWTHVAGVLNGANGDLDLYVNGSLVSHTTTALRPFRDLDPSSEPAVGIGNHGGAFHNFPYHGLIDEWSLYGRALSGQEILGIYQAGALGKCAINPRPGVMTLAADQLTTTSARLRGQVNPHGWPATAWFEWGTNTTYGNVIGMQDVGQDSSVSNLNVMLNGLMVGLNYHYRLVGTNVFGAVYGADQVFNTTPPTLTWTGADPSGYWSAPANWSPAIRPVNGTALVFPGGLPPEDKVSTNDLTDSFFGSIRFEQAGGHTIRGNPITLTNRSECIINSGTNVIDCDLTFAGTPSTPTYEFPSIRGYPGELTVIGNVGGGGLNVSIQQLVIRGQFTGGSIRVTYGSLALLGDNPHPVSAVIQGTTFSTLRVQGSQPNLNITMLLEMEVPSCPALTGDGVVGDVAVCGTVTPDSTLSVKNFGGQSDPNWRVLNIRLNGTNAGEYGKLVASGDLNLGMVRLLPSPSFHPQAGQVFTIVEKTSPGPILNTPFGPEGTITNLNGVPLRISYVGGDGNDVTLTAVTPVPIVLSAAQRFGTQFAFSYSADVGLRYAVERSATWSTWTTIWSNTANVNPMTFTDTAATNRMNFYRVRRWPNP